MAEEKQITGNDLQQLMTELNLRIKDLAEYWEIDRNTISKYLANGDQPLPRNKMMRILADDLKANFGKF